MKRTLAYKFKKIFIRTRKKIFVTKEPNIDNEARIAFNNLYIARSNFNEASDMSIDLAIFELLTAEERLNLVIRERKLEKNMNTTPIES